MIRYIIFAFDMYYPNGGAHDIIGRFVDGSNLETMIKYALNGEHKADYHQIYDLKKGEIIWSD